MQKLSGRCAERKTFAVRNYVLLLALVLAWIILSETFDPLFIFAGIIIGIFSIYLSRKYLPIKKIDNVSLSKLWFYPFYLLGQIYIGGIYVTKIILLGERTDVVTIKTHLEVESLRVMLADTITLTPGSILLDLDDKYIKVVWLRKRTDPDPELVENKDEILKGSLEKKLFKAQR